MLLDLVPYGFHFKNIFGNVPPNKLDLAKSHYGRALLTFVSHA